MTKHINIYLDHKSSKALSKIQDRFKVSLSTIADVLMQMTMKHTQLDRKELTENYLYKNLKKKTSCKPACTSLALSGYTTRQQSILATNVLNAYANKELDKLKVPSNFLQLVNTKLQAIDDIYYDLNRAIRVNKRAEYKLHGAKK